MAYHLLADSHDAEAVENARTLGFIPEVVGGTVANLVHPSGAHSIAPSADITAEDYIVGLEVLGHTFHVVRDSGGHQCLMNGYPHGPRPDGWYEHGLAIEHAFSVNGRRIGEAIDFLLARDGEAVFA